MKGTKLMSTITATTGSIEHQINHVGVRNWLLDGLTFSSGAIDSISFLGLGKVFTAFMTGNVAFLGMKIAGSPQPRLVSVLASMAAWGLAMGLQSGAVRKLKVEGIFTTAATGTFMVLAADAVNWKKTRDERRRARFVLLSLVIGATAGAYLFFHAPIFAPVLPLVITAGVVLAAARTHWSSDAPAALK